MTCDRRRFEGEPSLSEVLGDCVVRVTMESDGVDYDELIDAIRHAQLALRWRCQDNRSHGNAR